MTDATTYTPLRPARSEWVHARGLRLHVNAWGDAARVTPERPPLVMLHGWMDLGASFQFVVDAMREERYVLAPDARGFGLSDIPPAADGYWFPDYLADLDALLDAIIEPHWPGARIDLVGHSMGGNIAMLYAGIRTARIRRLVDLEGFGMPNTVAAQAPRRYETWLDQLKAPSQLRDYDGVADVAARLRKTDPLLRADRAAWLAAQWSAEIPGSGGRRKLLADPAHKHVNPVLYRRDEAVACWKRIAAPVLWVEGDRSEAIARWGAAFPPGELAIRIAAVPRVRREILGPAGHMVHHDQPEALARLIETFLDGDPAF